MAPTFVWMQPQGKLAVGLLQLCLAGVLINAQNLVVAGAVALGWSSAAHSPWHLEPARKAAPCQLESQFPLLRLPPALADGLCQHYEFQAHQSLGSPLNIIQQPISTRPQRPASVGSRQAKQQSRIKHLQTWCCVPLGTGSQASTLL